MTSGSRGFRRFCLLVSCLSLFPAITFAVQTPSEFGSPAQATWLPPVHVAPQRQSRQPEAAAAASPNQRFPGVFDPEPTPRQSVGTRFGDQTAHSSSAGSTSANRARGAYSPAMAGTSGVSPARGTRQASSQRPRQSVTNRGIGFEQPVAAFDSVEMTGVAMAPRQDAAADEEVQRAFVAETGPGAVPPEPSAERIATAPRETRGEFTRTPRPTPPAAPLATEFAELEQPLEGFAQTPAEPPANWNSSATTRQVPARQFSDNSVLDAPQSLPAWQTPAGGRPLPALPAAGNYAPNSERPAEAAPRGFAPVTSGTTPEMLEDSLAAEPWQDLDSLPRPQKTMSCDDLRAKLLSEPLTDIALDVSPPLPDRGDVPRLPAGDWVDHNGQLLARGQMVALSRGYVIVDTAEGRRKISVARLGDSSLALLATAWQLPGECAIGSGEYAGRCWTPQLSTWYASNLCHKPLYFEQVQLERYGHSAGPIMGPLRSSAHFFGSLVFWPYHSAIHPANECMYPLGYYRPGNCAPWLVEPFPISGPGAIRQGAVITGAAFLF